MRKKRFTVQTIARCGLLTAMMLVLGFIESLMPVAAGVPGIKLGLSNGVLLFALYMMDAPTAFLLMLLKVLLSGLLFGGVSAMMYAMAGGVCSMLGMILLKKLRFHIVTVSMAGAVLHNLGQVLLAMIILETDQLIYYMAVLLLVGEGEDQAMLEEKAADLGLSGRVIFYGVTDQPEELYCAMDVVAFASRFEGLGIVALEAQAAGLPVLCSEHIPEEALVSPNAQALPLGAGADTWGRTLLAMPSDKNCGREALYEKGFDIAEVARRVLDRYLEETP